MTPTVGGIALDALERQDNDARQMNANPVYEGAVNDGQYEQPHRDTWASGTYDTGNQRHQTLYEKLDHTNDAYEKPHVSTWTPENYDISEPQPVYNDPDAPVNPVATSIEPWGFGEDV